MERFPFAPNAVTGQAAQDSAACEGEFGSPLAVYAPKAGSSALYLITFLLLSVSSCYLCFRVISSPFPTTFVGIAAWTAALLFCGPLGWLLALVVLAGARYIGMRLEVYPDGIKILRWSRSSYWRWDDLQAVSYRMGAFYTLPAAPGRRPFNAMCMLQHSDGRKLILNEHLDKVRSLFETIDIEFCRRRLPEALAALAGGESLLIGSLRLSAEGLDNGREVIRWDSVERVHLVGAGTVVIVARGHALPWFSAPAAKVPNMPLLFVLASEMTRRLGASDPRIQTALRLPQPDADDMVKRGPADTDHIGPLLSPSMTEPDEAIERGKSDGNS